MKTHVGLILGWRTAALMVRCAAFMSGLFLWPDFAPAQVPVYSATEAPVVWRDYAQHVQARFRGWLAGDDVIRSFQGAAQDGRGQSKSSQTVMARVWISTG